MGKVTVDLKDTKTKWTAALEQLKEEQEPGEAAGTGGIATALDMMIPQITALIENGYTVPQIAEALQKTNVTKILPKHVTEAINRANKKSHGTARRKNGRKRKSGTTNDIGTQAVASERT